MMARIIHNLFLFFLFGMTIWFLSHADNRNLFLTSTPTSDNHGQHGLSQLRKHISNLDIKTNIITKNYQQLQELDSADKQQDSLLVLSLPAAIPANQQELASLADWVEKGNHLLVMLALDNSPHWLNKQNKFTSNDLLTTFNLQLTQLDTGRTAEDKSSQPSHLFTQLLHPVTNNVNRIQSHAVTQDHVWQLRGNSTPQSALILLREESTLSPVAWLSLYGKGKIYIFTHSDLFSNANINKADNMMLVNNIIEHSVEKTATVYFDDIHHIVPRMPRWNNPLLHPLVILFTGMLLYGLFAYLTNHSEPRRSRGRRTLSQFISDNSIQHARALSNRDIAMSYARLFFNSVRGRLDMPKNNQPAWDELRQKNVNQRLLQKTEKHYQRVLLMKRVNLNKFIVRLEKLRSQLK